MAHGKYKEYVEPRLLEIEAWCRDGLTNEQIAHNLGIGKTAFYKYQAEHEDFANALKKTKAIADIQVENMLFKKATGYYYTKQAVQMQREVIYKDGKRLKEVSKPIVVSYEEYVVPETAAQIFWLKNRKPDKWRDKVEQTVTGDVEIHHNNGFRQAVGVEVNVRGLGNLIADESK